MPDSSSALEKLKVPDGAPALPPATLRHLKEAFLVFDSDGSGRVTATELAAVLKHLGRDATEVELADMLSELSKYVGGADSLSFALEFCQLVARAADRSEAREAMCREQRWRPSQRRSPRVSAESARCGAL